MGITSARFPTGAVHARAARLPRRRRAVHRGRAAWRSTTRRSATSSSTSPRWRRRRDATPDDAAVRRGERLFADARMRDLPSPALRDGGSPRMRITSERRARRPEDLALHRPAAARHGRRSSPTAVPTSSATGRQWRTPPLWGIGLVQAVNGHQRLLHDGRADGVLEAILWHGGEAEASRDSVLQHAARRARRARQVRGVAMRSRETVRALCNARSCAEQIRFPCSPSRASWPPTALRAAHGCRPVLLGGEFRARAASRLHVAARPALRRRGARTRVARRCVVHEQPGAAGSRAAHGGAHVIGRTRWSPGRSSPP